MKRLTSGFVVLLLATHVWASDLNVRVTSAGEAIVNVPPGGAVFYEIRGVLSDTDNQGLALFGFDLHFTGGALEQADTPTGAISCSNPMPNFVIPEGITNPAGFGGTMIDGDLIQVGGGQNTINNTIDNAPYPIGTVIPNVARPRTCPDGTGEIILVRGVLTAPDEEGEYALELSELFANIIKEGETGVPYWATEAAEIGTIEDLTVRVRDCDVHLLSPASGVNSSLIRSARNTFRLIFDQDITAPTAEMIHIETLEPEGEFGTTNLSSGFTYTVVNDTHGLPRVLRIREIAKSLTNRTWYGVRNLGNWPGVCNFEADYRVLIGDATGDGIVTPPDVSVINAGPMGRVPPESRNDINGDGFVTPTDVSIVNASGGGPAPPKPSGH